MKTSILIDANVLIDVIGTGRGEARLWSLAALKHSSGTDEIVINAVVWAELADPSRAERDLVAKFDWLGARREDFPFAAAYTAGRAHRAYRLRGGSRERTLPDFLIGAHASVGGYRLLTRDPSRYRPYFPDLDIVAPDTHPLESFA